MQHATRPSKTDRRFAKDCNATSFDPQAIKQQLGISVSAWDSFMYRMKTLSERRVKSHEAMNYFLRVFTDPATTATGLSNEQAMKKVLVLYEGGWERFRACLLQGDDVRFAQCCHRICGSRASSQERRPQAGIGTVRPGCSAEAKGAGTDVADGSVNIPAIVTIARSS